MIVSHRHKFIFMHCRKAAGSSVTVSLSRYLGPLDIQIGACEDAFEQGIWPNLRGMTRLATPKGAASFVGTFPWRGRFKTAVSNAIKESYVDVIDAMPAHPLACSVKAAFPAAWDRYFKFCIVRNPFERVVSDYFWRTKGRRCVSPPTFSRYVAAMRAGDSLGGLVSSRFDNWEMYTIEDRIAVDRVVRFENLSTELTEAISELGIDWDGWLPRAKERKRKRLDYRDVYSGNDAAIVESLFIKEIECFGYVFDGVAK